MLLKAYKAARHQNKISDRSNFDCSADTFCLNDFMAQNGLNQSPDITLSDAQGSPAGIHGLLPENNNLMIKFLKTMSASLLNSRSTSSKHFDKVAGMKHFKLSVLLSDGKNV